MAKTLLRPLRPQCCVDAKYKKMEELAKKKADIYIIKKYTCTISILNNLRQQNFLRPSQGGLSLSLSLSLKIVENTNHQS